MMLFVIGWLRVCTLFAMAALVLACSRTPSSSVPSVPVAPIRVSVADPMMRELLLDTAEGQTCARLTRRFVPLPPKVDRYRASGRWLIEECSVQRNGQTLFLNVGGPGWAWVDEIEKGFRVQQFIYFSARATLVGTADIAYDAHARVASVWLTPTAVPAVSFQPQSQLNAQPQGLLASFVGFLAPGTVADTAREAAEKKGHDAFVDSFRGGATITYNVPANQFDFSPGVLGGGAMPAHPFATPGWLMNERQELHPGGAQIAGPFPYAQTAMLTIEVEQGNDLHYAPVCADAAYAAVRQFTIASGRQTPVPFAFVQPGARYSIRISPPPCEWVLVTYSQTDTIVRFLVTR